MKYFSEETRQRMSESAKRRCTPEWKERKRKAMSTPLDVDKIRSLYSEGHTQDEIAELMGVSQKAIWRSMKNNAIIARVAAKRDQRGDKNSSWKGDEAKYAALHLRVESCRGKAKESGCSVCGTTSREETYDWANMSGSYNDINDYAPMCRKCHRAYDASRRKGA